MGPRGFVLNVSFLLCALAGVMFSVANALAAPGGQQSSRALAVSPKVEKVQTNLVLVDAVVTGKHGEYVTNLDAKDFKVYEDGKDQKIVSFSRPEVANGPAGAAQQHYIVLLFDVPSMSLPDQQRLRLAAKEFIAKYAAPDHPMAIANFNGVLQIAQNFTNDADRLRAVAARTIMPFAPLGDGGSQSSSGGGEVTAASDSASMAAPGYNTAYGFSMTQFATYDFLLALRDMAEDLQPVPGRKTVILFSTGFSIRDPEMMYELTAAIAACNKANVAIYPVDVRGLVATGGDASQPGSELIDPLFPHLPYELAFLLMPPAPDPQQGGRGPGGGGPGGGPGGGGGGIGPGGGGRGPGGGGGGIGPGGGGRGPGGGGPGGGGRGPGGGGPGPGGGGRGPGGGGGGGGRGGNGGNGGSGGGPPAGYNPGANFNPNSRFQPQVILPHFNLSLSPADTQMGLRELALGTGGFWILNTNDFLGGLDKIAAELNQYYVLGYYPPAKTGEGACHAIKVKVERGLEVRFRSGYCDVPGTDILAGKAEGKSLEQAAASASPGTIPLSVQADYFYTAPDAARVDVALGVPGSSLSFEKAKHELQTEVNILGIAYRRDGSVAARFSDTQKVRIEKGEQEEFENQPFVYRDSFAIAPGRYNLKVVVSSGGKAYAKSAVPLEIEPFNGKRLQLSGLVLSDTVRRTSEEPARLAEEIIAGGTPLVVAGLEIFPSPTNRFSKPARIAVYSEIFDPDPVQSGEPGVTISFTVVDAKTNREVYQSPADPVARFVRPGNPVIPVAMWLSTASLSPGKYRLEIVARDSSRYSPVQTAEFALE